PRPWTFRTSLRATAAPVCSAGRRPRRLSLESGWSCNKTVFMAAPCRRCSSSMELGATARSRPWIQQASGGGARPRFDGASKRTSVAAQLSDCDALALAAPRLHRTAGEPLLERMLVAPAAREFTHAFERDAVLGFHRLDQALEHRQPVSTAD